MYQVFDNGKPADCLHHKVDTSWHTSYFLSFEEAVRYALKWIGFYELELDIQDHPFKVGVPYDYSGYGDTIVIREINDCSHPWHDNPGLITPCPECGANGS